jgi:glycerate kinase
MASASGLVLLSPDERDATRTSTRGTGELIAAALSAGARRILVGVGGSATCDGGTGMAAALGVRFLDGSGQEVEPCGGRLVDVRAIDAASRDARLDDVRVQVACDVDAPLLGPFGAARVYAPQKGAAPEQVDRLEAGMGNLADCIERDLGVDVRELPGAGAAGGLGAGLRAFVGGELCRGAELVLEQVGLRDQLEGADVVITAEGRLDAQTAQGKAPAAVAAAARAAGLPCLAVAGSVADDRAALRAMGIDAAFTLCPGPASLDEAMENAGPWLESATEEAARAFLAGRGRASPGG